MVEVVPFEEVESISPFAHLSGRYNNRTFAERLAEAPPSVKERYEAIAAHLGAAKGVRKIAAKKQETFKRGHLPVARLVMKGKTLNAYLALDPARFENTKYIFTDVSARKKFAQYPMRVRLTSERQKRWTLELLTTLLADYGIKGEEGGV